MELDFSRQLHFFLALLPEIILCAWAMVVLLAGVSGKHRPEATADEPGDPSDPWLIRSSTIRDTQHDRRCPMSAVYLFESLRGPRFDEEFVAVAAVAEDRAARDARIVDP